MAEEVIEIIDDDNDESQKSEGPVKKDTMECPICLQTCIHPAKLPCGHIFCFLCVKGVAYKNRRCAMCRREIPPEFLDHPQLVLGLEELSKTKTTEDGYQWFYEGRNGWWQYDERTSQDIEEAYKKGEKSCTILVAGYVYVVDFEAMLQQRQNDPSRRRHVKRDLASIPKKGVAGLRIEQGGAGGDTSSSLPSNLESMFVTTTLSESAHSTTGGDTIPTSIYNRHHMNSSSSSSSNNLISTIAATDAASRIASDIIGSTLAHADEVIRSDNNLLEFNNQSLSSSTRELFEEAEELLNATVGANIIIPTPTTVDHRYHHHHLSPSSSSSVDLFSQTLENFRTLTLRNVRLDSSDSEDDEQIL